jgi:circadian clock protein KaiB
MAVRKRILRKSGTTAKSGQQRYDLRLYVTGQTPRSLRSVRNLVAICDRYLKGRFDLQVVDLYQQPALAAENQVMAAPTLIKAMPLPLRRLVGDLSDEKRVLKGLGLELSAA